jgi:hypothetical protein
VAAVEGTITSLKEKKQWYSVQPRPPRKTAEERAAELAEREKKREEARAGAGAGGEEGAAKPEGGKEGGGGKGKREKKPPKEFKSCESWIVGVGCGGWWLGLLVGGGLRGDIDAASTYIYLRIHTYTGMDPPTHQLTRF